MLFAKKREPEIIDTQATLENCVEFSLLDPRAIENDIRTLVNIAIRNSYYAVCVNPVNVYTAKEYINKTAKADIKVVATIGFPLGANKIDTKVEEAKSAVADGADELDVVINISKVKENDYGYIKNELSRIVRISKGRIVKAVIESCYLSREEIKNVCKVCLKSKVDFIMTSTGYGTGGACFEDISLIKEVVESRCGIKASGGIKTRSQADEFLRAGANRIGTSKVI